MTVKKIGVVCCHNIANYGSRLQIFALQKVLTEKCGVTNEIIDYTVCAEAHTRAIQILLKITKVFSAEWWYEKIKKNAPVHNATISDDNRAIRTQRLNQFKNDRFVFSKRIEDYARLKEISFEYDVILCGSDQIWNPACLSNPYYMLAFTKKAKRTVAYASSIGVEKIDKTFFKWYRYYLSHIDVITMREQTGAQVMSNILNRPIDTVVDPVALLTLKEWCEIEKPISLSVGKYIFCYFLGSNLIHRQFADRVAKKYGYSIVTFPNLKSTSELDMTWGDERLYDAQPEQLLSLVHNAELVITDSFHVTLFSIIYEKQFMTIARYSEGKVSTNSRLKDMFSLFGLENRLYKGDENIENYSLIDYSKIRDVMAKERERSLQILRAMVGGNVQA